MKVKIKDRDGFDNVFGADCFLECFPELLTTGVEVRRHNDFYYVFRDGKFVHDSSFFTEEEMQYLEIID
ncbi:MAG TPA: hypothetical protein VFM18_17845 [Methanosarcina sp.]|nr:hypothetical protein [Methanosarcina sp.]